MPIVKNITVKDVKFVWKAPDGSREINELTMEYEGKQFKANTFSSDMAQEGWNGDVETYEKPGNGGRPSQTFVKQAPKEDSSYAGSGGTSSGRSAVGGSSYTPKDEKAIQAMWAIKTSAIVHCKAEDLDPAELDSVESYAIEMMAMVDRVKVSGVDTSQLPPKEKPDEVITDIGDGPITDLDELDEILGKTEPVRGEIPWHKS